MRAFRLMSVLAAASAAGLMFAAPASAQGALAGGGAVQGSVSLSPGFPPAPACLPLCPQTFSFSGTVTGAFAGAGSTASAATGVAEGNLNATAVGASIVENSAAGVGNISVSASGTLSCIGACWDSSGNHCIGICNMSVTVVCTGVYVRLGVPTVVALPTCTISANGFSYTSVVVAAGAFVPNQLPTTTITSAGFDGAFVGGGALA